MKIKILALLCLGLTTVVSCKEDYLEKPPLDQLSDGTYWTNEANVRTFAYGFYTDYFTGYGSGNTWGNYFSGQALNDDFASGTPPEYTRVVPASGGGWTFTYVRKANLFLSKVQNMEVDADMPEEAKLHWQGIGRFFRGLEYFDLVKRFGDVPYYDQVIDEKDVALLYQPRDPRTLVMDKVLEDFKYAAANVRAVDGKAGLTVNKYVVLAFMSRVFLFEGTWQKYHMNNTAKAKEYLEAAKWAAAEVIASKKYSLKNYRDVFSSLDLNGNTEVLLYRQYVEGVLTHALMSYNNKEAQTGAPKDLIESYLASDGLPISLSTVYQGDKTIAQVMTNRDPRIKETFVSELRPAGVVSASSTTGYATHKFLNESIKDQTIGTLNLNPTDAPIIRFGEVLINYAEAAAELATVGGPALTNEDLNLSVNVLRSRPGINMPALQVSGDVAVVRNVPYTDPQKDADISSILWEIRRERRVELVYEGFRWDDLRRWKKLEYTDTQANPDINRGAYLKKSDFPKLAASVVLDMDPADSEGYITPAWKPESQRKFTNPRIYLNPIPQDQIVLYKENGSTLTQNPGWE
ncbi:MAG: RagB/SusD family nutrient uptake outer membrane protein [Arcticibacter sp.]